mmetsp:Transcript_10054/g.20779  ORF Transcript_10054/g.20779 Transcript_10054/m.20779 type:complete len:105 (-) Transcript_10054:177-491(-)|eukprot:CAMPEP_0172467128 /NCGR_PEP_ID=MMETSP1065-20121228/58024_1 /TAXON_ID=265537 /ORGANISM="Amphiprora paludosa, Strain CCMP125" /LENGTH=104 /DNA_ID=CAMNT_0013224175 /DNA_START=34 /DNA_END=348 /DNA_ORIENTATION=-
MGCNSSKQMGLANIDDSILVAMGKGKNNKLTQANDSIAFTLADVPDGHKKTNFNKPNKNKQTQRANPHYRPRAPHPLLKAGNDDWQNTTSVDTAQTEASEGEQI